MRIHPRPTSKAVSTFLLSKTSRLKRTRILPVLVAIALAIIAAGASAASRSSFGRLFLDSDGSSTNIPSEQPSEAHANIAMMAVAFPQGGSSLNSARRGHTATRLADGRVLIAGGENDTGQLNGTEIYDPASGTFSVSGNMTAARANHAAIKLNDGRVLITGGRDGSGSLETTEIFDPASGTLTSGPAMGVARAGQSATLFADGRVFIAGGDAGGSAEMFDPSTGAFTGLGAGLNHARSMHSAALLLDGSVLIVGGQDSGGNGLSSGEIFDPASQTFSTIPSSMTDVRKRAVLRVLSDGKVQIIGGNDHNSMELYDSAGETFGAHAHVLPAFDDHPDLINNIMRAPTRAALIHDQRTITELTGANQALGAGGVDSGGNALNQATVYQSSSASVTTGKLDYSPGTPVVVTGRGFQPNEIVTLTFHEDPHTHAENVGSVQADADGNFTYDQYAPEEHDIGVTFVLDAEGESSGWTAQTTFTDGTISNASLTVGITCGPSTASVPQGTTVCGRATYDVSGSGNTNFSMRWFNPSGVQQQSTGGSHTNNTNLSGTTFDATFAVPSGAPTGTWTVRFCESQASAANCGTQRAVATFDVTAANTAPTVTLNGDALANEGDTKTYTFTTSDPDAAETFSLVEATCGANGNKSNESFNSSTGAGSFDCTFPDGPANSTVNVEVSDGDASDSDSINVTISNVGPTVAFTGGPTEVDENTVTGHTYTYSISDPGDDTIDSVVTSCGTGGTKVVGSDTNDDTSGSFKCIFPDGPASPTVTASATDSDGATGNTAMLGVTVNNVAPTVTADFVSASVNCGAVNSTLNISFVDPGTDTHTYTINWGDGSSTDPIAVGTNPFNASHTYAAAGVFNASVTITDSDGDSGEDNVNSLTVNFTIIGGGILPPIKPDGTSIFKSKSTIPIKIQAQDCNGSFPSNLAPQIRVYKTSGQTPYGDAIEVDSTSAADTGGVLRFTGAPDYQYIYNMAAKSLPDPSASYLLEVTIPLTNQKIYANFALKP